MAGAERAGTPFPSREEHGHPAIGTEGTLPEPCERCDGSGEIQESISQHDPWDTLARDCPHCGGTGERE